MTENTNFLLILVYLYLNKNCYLIKRKDGREARRMRRRKKDEINIETTIII